MSGQAEICQVMVRCSSTREKEAIERYLRVIEERYDSRLPGSALLAYFESNESQIGPSFSPFNHVPNYIRLYPFVFNYPLIPS